MPKKLKLIYIYFLVDLKNKTKEQINIIELERKSRKSRSSIHNLAVIPYESSPLHWYVDRSEMRFYLICLCISVYFSMVFTNWSSISDHLFTGLGVIDYSNYWIRFGTLIFSATLVLIQSLRVINK